MRKFLLFLCVFSLVFFIDGSGTVFARPRCIPGDPVLTIWYRSTPVTRGDIGSILTKIGNGDSDDCRDSRFSIHTNIPNSWHPTTILRGSELIPADGLMTPTLNKQIQFKVPANAPNQLYSFVVTAKNNRTNRTTSQTVTIDVNPNHLPVITSMTPASGPVGTHVSLVGNNFGPMPELAFQDNEHGLFYVRGVPSDGFTFSFNIPERLSLYSCGCQGSTTPALYNVSIGNNGIYSNIMHFTVTQ